MSDDPVGKLYETTYRFEHQRRDTLNSRLSLPVATLTVLIGAITYLGNNLPKPLEFFGILCLSGLAGAFIAIGFAFYYLSRAVFVNRYMYLPGVDKIEDYIQTAQRYNETRPSDSIDIEKTVMGKLRERYREAAKVNAERNDRKSGYLSRSLKSLVTGSVLIAAAAVPFYVARFHSANDLTNP